MKKVFKLEDLDCANCAAKMEEAISKMENVNSVRVNFMTQKLTIDIQDDKFDTTMDAVQKTINKVEPDCHIIR
ncbi:cation transporter [[Clostridium] polysaccharolyticum]|jgi:copper chaperone CopZ|uniref:Heavy-metal-associated domain-containing protein n=1 Tax=[Clostridium] polysaccharolyticum TaxID=29364 RepID=A0A1I0DXK6_9FIRM|nr:cation transporter [[Clostridium] polysaccharolyticum]SET36763.1 Heavy-metal-associated domain-containing protein [[Clostridium] polysaccharolyticum]